VHVRTITSRFIALSLSMAAASAAHAQVDQGSLERTVPKLEVKPIERRPSIATPALPPEEGARVAGTFVLSAVNIEGATVFSSAELSQTFEPYLASRIGQAELDKIAADITERYRHAGYLLSYAMVPEQFVQSGIVRIRVVEGYVEKVRIEGDRRSATAVRALAARLSADRPLRKSTLERLLGLMRDVPGVVVSDTRLSRSPRDPARHQLTIALRANRIREILYSDNRGTVGGARLRGYSSTSLSWLTVPGDQLQLDLFSIPSDDFRYFYGQAKASLPIGSDGLHFSASVSRASSFRRLPGSDQHGNSRQLAADLAYPFAKSRAFSLVGHLSIVDWKSEEKVAGTVFQKDRIQVARAWVEFSRVKKTRIDGRIGISRGLDLGPPKEPGDPLASRPFGKPEFTKLNADLQIVAPLSDRVTVRFDGSAQVSTDSLLATEEFALGGSRIGRAFDFNEVTGDQGIGGMVELGYRLGDVGTKLKALELFAFTDGGGAFRKRSILGLPGEEWIASVGGGTRFSTFGLSFAGEVGVPVSRSKIDRGVRAFLSVTRAL
jgi:hemolysin activation/secretion protein